MGNFLLGMRKLGDSPKADIMAASLEPKPKMFLWVGATVDSRDSPLLSLAQLAILDIYKLINHREPIAMASLVLVTKKIP